VIDERIPLCQACGENQAFHRHPAVGIGLVCQDCYESLGGSLADADDRDDRARPDTGGDGGPA
jgi:hypothetical protein